MPSRTVKLVIAAAFSAFVMESRATETVPKAPAAAPAPAAAKPAAAEAKTPAPAAQGTGAEGVAAQNAPAAAGKKSCEEVKADIDSKIKAKGVKAFTLDIVGADEAKDAKVVGTCEGGKKKITYKRG